MTTRQPSLMQVERQGSPFAYDPLRPRLLALKRIPKRQISDASPAHLRRISDVARAAEESRILQVGWH